MQVYYAQRAFHKTQGRWAATLGRMHFPFAPTAHIPKPPVIQSTAQGYNAACAIHSKREQSRLAGA